jgi:hypothetical protein
VRSIITTLPLISSATRAFALLGVAMGAEAFGRVDVDKADLLRASLRRHRARQCHGIAIDDDDAVAINRLGSYRRRRTDRQQGHDD